MFFFWLAWLRVISMSDLQTHGCSFWLASFVTRETVPFIVMNISLNDKIPASLFCPMPSAVLVFGVVKICESQFLKKYCTWFSVIFFPVISYSNTITSHLLLEDFLICVIWWALPVSVETLLWYCPLMDGWRTTHKPWRSNLINTSSTPLCSTSNRCTNIVLFVSVSSNV